MSKLKLDLLASIQLREILTGPSLRAAKVSKNPTTSDLRVFSDGSCYPSKALVDEFQLEFQPKGSTSPEFGFDIFETSKWGMWPLTEHFLMIASVSKHEKKVDLFAKTAYDEKNQPKNSVMTQGSGTFGKKLIEMVEKTYGVELFKDGNTFVDLKILKDTPIAPTKNGIYSIPKVIVKGTKAGEDSYERRENITIYPLIIDEESMKTALEQEEAIQDPLIADIAALGGAVSTIQTAQAQATTLPPVAALPQSIFEGLENALGTAHDILQQN